MLKLSSGTHEDQQRPAGPQNERPNQNNRDEGSSIGDVSPKSTQVNRDKEVKVGGKEDVLAFLAHVPPFPKNCPDPSPTDLPAKKKHNTVPPQSLNADPLAQIIGMEMIADVIMLQLVLYFTQEPLLTSYPWPMLRHEVLI